MAKLARSMRPRSSTTVFQTKLFKFDDGEGRTAYGRLTVVYNWKLGRRVIDGYTVLHHCGYRPLKLDIVSPCAVMTTKQRALRWIYRNHKDLRTWLKPFLKGGK